MLNNEGNNEQTITIKNVGKKKKRNRSGRRCRSKQNKYTHIPIVWSHYFSAVMFVQLKSNIIYFNLREQYAKYKEVSKLNKHE